MAVLAEGISVVVRLDAIERLMEDDWANFVAIAPNQTLCCDNELARVGSARPGSPGRGAGPDRGDDKGAGGVMALLEFPL